MSMRILFDRELSFLNVIEMKNRFFLKVGVTAGLMLIVSTCSLQAQYYTAIGVRIGGTSGVAAKYFYKPAFAAEGIIGTFGNGFSLTGLIEKYVPVENVQGLYTYYGGGAHLAFYNGTNSYYGHFGREVDYRKNNDVGFGVNGIVGIEYRLPENIPLAISFDLKPFIEVGSGGYVSVAPDPSIGIKFIIH